ncbi:MAG: C-terminal binding protein, partial [Deltaproteobacteria bacterium]|nr:C-terminal binding protein [Deltaproteobacteria bacterium]
DFLLKEADYISINAPLTPETRHMFSREIFLKMKPNAVLINTARGAIVDEKALYQALAEGRILGAGLDVTDPEPPSPGSPLLKLEQVLITGHSAFYSETSVAELYRKGAEAILMALKGQWPPFLANPEVRERSNRRIP